MSEGEARESRKAFRAKQYTLGAFNNDELRALIYGLRATAKGKGHALHDELAEELEIRGHEEGFTP
jgi:hypothetical protein